MMDISRWYRNTSLLALSLSINSALRVDNNRNEAIRDLAGEKEKPRRYQDSSKGSKSRAVVALPARMRRESVPAS